MVAPSIDVGTLDAITHNSPTLNLNVTRGAVFVPGKMEYTGSDDIMLFTGSTDKMEYRN